MQTKSGTDFHILIILFLNWQIQNFSTMVMLCGCDRSASTFSPGKWCSWSSNSDMVISSLVTLVVTALPLLIIPPTLLVAATRAAIHGHCCQVWRCSPHFKDFKEHKTCFQHILSDHDHSGWPIQNHQHPYTSLNKSDQVKFKQSAGELLLVFLVTLVYLGTITGSVLPR